MGSRVRLQRGSDSTGLLFSAIIMKEIGRRKWVWLQIMEGGVKGKKDKRKRMRRRRKERERTGVEEKEGNGTVKG